MNHMLTSLVFSPTKSLKIMKKINLSLFGLLLASAFVFVACNQETSTEEVVVEEEAVIEEGVSGSFIADQENSSFTWLGKKVTGEHFGTIAVVDAKFTMEDGVLVSGKAVASVASITVDDIEDAEMNAKLLGHLNSEDFFNTEAFPQAFLEITGKGDDGSAVGTLTIKDISNPVEFTYEVAKTENGAVLTGNIVVDRTLYDIKYGSGKFFEDLGDKTIYDEFDLGFTITGVAL